MPEVKTEVFAQAPPEKCYNIACDMEKFPGMMEAVEEVTVQERGEGWMVTRWVGRFQGRPVTWTERDELNDDELTIDYDQISGDLKVFRGRWNFHPEDGGCRIELAAEASLGIPMLQAALDPLVRKIVSDNCKQMLEAIKEKAEED